MQAIQAEFLYPLQVMVLKGTIPGVECADIPARPSWPLKACPLLFLSFVRFVAAHRLSIQEYLKAPGIKSQAPLGKPLTKGHRLDRRQLVRLDAAPLAKKLDVKLQKPFFFPNPSYASLASIMPVPQRQRPKVTVLV